MKHASASSFFPMLPSQFASALTGETSIAFSAPSPKSGAAPARVSAGVLNRLTRSVRRQSPPMVAISGSSFSTRPSRGREQTLSTPEFVLFVNDTQLLGETYARYLEAQIRAAHPFVGLPLMLNFRPRSETARQKEHR
jgi:predicted GTPase